MPITINYKSLPTYVSDANAHLPVPVYGKNELHIEQMGINERQYEQVNRKFHFCMGYLSPEVKTAKFIISTHQWLSKYCISPWYLEGGWCNHGHSYDCSVHIEQFAQRDEFENSKLGKHFSRKDKEDSFFYDRKNEIHDLAMIKGIIPAYGASESLKTWIRVNEGYDSGEIKIGGTRYYYITPEREEISAAIKHLPNFRPLKKQDKYICPLSTCNFDKVMDWKRNVEAVTLDYKDLRAPDFLNIKIRYPEVEEEFKESWGSFFHYNNKNKLYYCSFDERPTLPKREVPKNFIDYLEGRGPDPSPKLAL